MSDERRPKVDVWHVGFSRAVHDCNHIADPCETKVSRTADCCFGAVRLPVDLEVVGADVDSQAQRCLRANTTLYLGVFVEAARRAVFLCVLVAGRLDRPNDGPLELDLAP